MSLVKITLGFLFTTIACKGLAQQSCNEYLDKTSPKEKFQFLANGEMVLDRSTGLTWKRCLEGQVFSNNGTNDIFIDDSCTGAPTQYLRMDALNYVKNLSDYRLPNIKELASIAELQCKMPAINNTAFPNQPNTWVWSATMINIENHQLILSLNFSTGVDGINGAENSLIRLLKK